MNKFEAAVNESEKKNTVSRDRLEFIQKCREILEVKGTSDEDGFAININGTGIRQFEDDEIKITGSLNDQQLEVERKENMNPVVMVVSDGEVIRVHGEYIKLTDHVDQLYQEI